MPAGQRTDDLTVADDEIVWRGITADQIGLDPVTGQVIPRERAFRTQEVSVNFAAQTTVAAMMAKFAGWTMFALTAKQVRDSGCIIVRDPLPEDPSHAVILRGDKPGERLTGAQAGQLRRAGRWVGEPPAPNP